MIEHYQNKEENCKEYFANVRIDLLDLIPEKLKGGKLLEIGAASGNTLVYAKENKFATEVVGMELCEIENSNQKNKVIDDFIIGNVETLKFPYAKKSFDVILCGDVLEHLIDPYTMVEKLREYLNDNGILIISLPNIREKKVLKQLIFQGNFKYEESGILDRTHLRFFAKKNMIALLEERGFKIHQIKSNAQCDTKQHLKKRKYFKALKCLLRYKLFEEFITVQYYLSAYKK